MTMPIGRDILRSVYDVLEPGGAFVAYQVRDRVHTLGREVFGRARVQTELLNVPPMRIYRWEKHATDSSRAVSA
jgi:phosphatidylethanolamine/phosphatidyl-N-methylethanolamine N-methyltransferase